MIIVSVASGTSADGVDAGLVDLEWDADGGLALDVLDAWTAPWPAGLADRLLALLPPAGTTAAEVCALDTAVGRAVAGVAAQAVARCRDRFGRDPELVVSPGQTIHHEVRDGVCHGTLQIGQPAWVVEATGLPVLSDLRARDVSAGGHGAPLVSRFDELWLAGDRVRAALNLGGIANVTVVGPDRPVLAWDTGPANCLLDVAAARATDGALRYDRDGALARSGRVHAGLLDRLLQHPHFAAPPPVSTGRETFSAGLLDSALADAGLLDAGPSHIGPRGTGPRDTGPDYPALPWADVLATLTELTARTVGDALAPFGVDEVVASGGGVANPALMEALARTLAPARLRSSDDLGVPADAKEAVMWAVLGFLTWHGLPAASPATGAPVPRMLGRISPGDRPLRLPEPAPAAPGHLRVMTRKVSP